MALDQTRDPQEGVEVRTGNSSGSGGSLGVGEAGVEGKATGVGRCGGGRESLGDMTVLILCLHNNSKC